MIGIQSTEFVDEDINIISDSLVRKSSRGWQPSTQALNDIVNQSNYVNDDLDWARGEVLWDKYE